jgi:copper homeostasis protein
MSVPVLLEIAVESVGAARAAERGGAHRIELCAHLNIGGITPSSKLQRAVRSAVRIPIHVLIRSRDGNFLYSKSETEIMKQQIETAKHVGMNGVVLGVLKADQSVDVETTRELVLHAGPLPVTFHRAFDETPDLRQSLEDVCSTGATRILSSGGAKDALSGALALRSLVQEAGDRISVMPGGGIRSGNLSELLRATRAREFHSGLGSVMHYNSEDFAGFAMEVRKLAGQIRESA